MYSKSVIINIVLASIKTLCLYIYVFLTVLHIGYFLGYGVLCCDVAPLTLYGNAVHSNRDIGICVKQDTGVTIECNSVTSNHGAGIRACCKTGVCRIYRPRAICRLRAQHDCRLVVIQKVKMMLWLVLIYFDYDRFQIEIKLNGIYENLGEGVVLNGKADVYENDIFCNKSSAISVQDHTSVQVGVVPWLLSFKSQSTDGLVTGILTLSFFTCTNLSRLSTTACTRIPTRFT